MQPGELVKFALWNVQSLNQTKSLGVTEYLLENNVHVACLSETWFHDESNYQTALLANAVNYSVYSRPRITDTIGGGVCILLKNKFKSVLLKNGISHLLSRSLFSPAYLTCLVKN